MQRVYVRCAYCENNKRYEKYDYLWEPRAQDSLLHKYLFNNLAISFG